MTAVWLQAFAGLAGLVSLWLRDYYSAQKVEDRYRDEIDQDIQELRQEVVSGDADAVSARIGRLPTPDGGNAGSASGGRESGTADAVRRLGRLGIRNG